MLANENQLLKSSWRIQNPGKKWVMEQTKQAQLEKG